MRITSASFATVYSTSPARSNVGIPFARRVSTQASESASRCPLCRLTVAKKSGNIIPNRVLKGLIENLTVRCKNRARDPDNEPDSQRRRLSTGEDSASDGSQLLCGVPGPKWTEWEEGLFPILMTWNSDPDSPPLCKYPKGFYHINVFLSGLICNDLVHPEISWHREISMPELLFSLQHHLAHPDTHAVQQVGPYQDSREKYNQKIERQARHFTREDFLGIASLSFELKPDDWILVTDTMGGTGLGGKAPTAQSAPAEPTIENASTKDCSCSCSCCAWGDPSLWDERREMRFLRGSTDYSNQ